MTSPDDLRALAERYRRMVFGFTDQRAINALSDLAMEYEAQATRLELAARHRPASIYWGRSLMGVGRAPARPFGR